MSNSVQPTWAPQRDLRSQGYGLSFLVIWALSLALSVGLGDDLGFGGSAWAVALLGAPVAVLGTANVVHRTGVPSWSTPIGLALAYLWVSVVCVPILWRLGWAEPWPNWRADPTLTVAIGLLAMFAVTAGAQMGSRGDFTPYRVATSRGVPSRIYGLGIASGILSIAMLLNQTGGLATTLGRLAERRELLSGLGALGILAGICASIALLGAMNSHRTPASKIGDYFCFALYSAYVFLSGSRFALIAFFISYLIALCFARRIRTVRVFVLAAVAAPFSVWYAFSVRHGGAGDPFSGREGPIRALVDPLVFGGFDVLRTFEATISQGLSGATFRMYEWMGGVLTLVPRGVWPGKPSGVSVNFSALYFPDRWRDGTGVPPSLPAESVYVFGAVLAPIYLFAVGWFLVWASRRIWRSSSVGSRIFGAFAIPDCIVFVKSGSDSFLRLATVHCICAVIVGYLARRADLRLERSHFE